MRGPKTLFALPATVLLVLLSDITRVQAAERNNPQLRWPYNRPPHVKYWPEDPPHRRRDLEAIQEHIRAGHTPVSVKKMSRDESEKFFPEFWGFDEPHDRFAILDGVEMKSIKNSLQIEDIDEDVQLSANGSNLSSFRPAFALHAMQESTLHPERLDGIVAKGKFRRKSAVALPLLESRGFQCPDGTSPCSTIAPNLCCAQGETCFNIPDSGLGTVGCCPNRATCTGNITCAAGNTPCDSQIGGGCCISGYICADVGCVIQVTVVSSITHIASSATIAVTTSIPTASSSSSLSSSTSVVMDTALQTTTSCACGFQACPVALGGGCCPTDRLCGPTNLCPMPSSTNTVNVLSVGSCNTAATTTAPASAPVRPTSGSENLIAATTTSSTPTVVGGSCPTGFYACSAYYGGGCCRTGRDCATTDCPSTASITLVSSGVTIVVPLTGDATTTASGSCPTSWYGCAANLDGNCCPNGWTCGIESCTSVGATGTASSPKQGVVLGEGSRSHGDCHWAIGVVGCIVFCLLFV